MERKRREGEGVEMMNGMERNAIEWNGPERTGTKV